MIYTSYFSKYKYVPNPISIARSSPKWFVGEKLLLLAPTMGLVFEYKQGLVTAKDYIQRYIVELHERGVSLATISKLIPDGCTLLCWETPDLFCHRHIVAKMLKKSGVACEEWNG